MRKLMCIVATAGFVGGAALVGEAGRFAFGATPVTSAGGVGPSGIYIARSTALGPSGIDVSGGAVVLLPHARSNPNARSGNTQTPPPVQEPPQDDAAASGSGEGPGGTPTGAVATDVTGAGDLRDVGMLGSLGPSGIGTGSSVRTTLRSSAQRASTTGDRVTRGLGGGQSGSGSPSGTSGGRSGATPVGGSGTTPTGSR